LPFGGLNTMAKAAKFAIETRKKYSYNLYRHCIAMTVHYFNHSCLNAIACFSNICLSTQTAKLFAPDNLM
jgi:hypothetical protein